MAYTESFYDSPPRELYLVQEGARWRVYFKPGPARAARTRYNNWGSREHRAVVWKVSLERMEEVE